MLKTLTLLKICVLLFSCSPAKQLNQDIQSVTFQLIDNRPFIEAEVNGIKGKFIVDTGGVHGLNADFAEKAGVVKSDSFTIRGAGDGTQYAWRGGATTFKILSTSIETTSSDPIILNLNAVRDSLSLPFLDGVIGVELFRSFDVSINYPARRMTFYNKGNHPKEGFEIVPFTFYRNHIPMIKLKLANKEGDFTLDTGDRSMLTIFPEFFNTMDTSNIQLSELQKTGYSVGGPIMAREFTLNASEINQAIRFLSVKTRVPDHTSGAWAQNSHAGNIGSGLIKDYEVIFDYDKQEILFKKPPTLSIKEFTYHSSNFEITTQWYLDRLPFEVIAKTDSSMTMQYQYAKITFIKNQNLPTLSTYKEQRNNKQPNGVSKYGFDVPDVDEVIKTYFPNPDDRYLNTIRFWGQKMFLVKDTEGNVIHFFEGGSFWKNSFYALMTDSKNQYQEFVEFAERNDMILSSDFSNENTGVMQQSYHHSDVKLELIKLDARAESPYNKIGSSGIQLENVYSSFTKANIPPLRHHSAGVYSDDVYLFGGTSINNWTGHTDLWKLENQTWKKINEYGPAPRSSLAFFSAPNSKTIYLLGGWDNNNVLSDFWKYENDKWILIAESTELGQRYSPGVTFDKKNNRFILYGGCGLSGENYGDTWSYKDGNWTLLQSESSPGSRCRPQLAYDEINEKVLLFGGSGGDPKTWVLNDDQWEVISSEGPQSRYNHSMICDEKRNRIVLFGGSAPGGIRFNDTWEWDGNSWQEMKPISSPSKRDMSVMIYNPAQQHTYLIGGRTPKWNPINDLWNWDGENWNKIY